MHKYSVGDKVWVVRIPGPRQPVKPGEYRTVVKLGRMYGYLESQGYSSGRFELATGYSHDGSENGNHRSNGWGFDVYPSKEAYDQKMSDKAEAERLSKRLLAGYHPRLIDLSPQAVAAIHAILNQEGIDNA